MVTEDVDLLRRRARATALMLGAGALLIIMSLLTPGSVAAGSPRNTFVVVGVVCAVGAVIASVRRERLPTAMAMMALLTGDVVIAIVTLIANERAGGNADLLLLLWPTLAAAVFLSRRLVVVQVVAAALVGVAVFHRAEAGVGVAVVQVAVLTTSVALAALVVVQLRERLTEAVQASHRLSLTDPLTGLVNRRGFEERLPALWNAASRRGETLTVLLIDLDHFKAVNDEHGHATGDRVLEGVGALVRSLVRNEDIVARFGGEELVLVAAEPAVAGRDAIGERLRAAVESADLPVPVTVSVGSVVFAPDPADDPMVALNSLIEQADGAMYEAKRAGRNRVISCAPVSAP